jgi:hypothetical protein
VPPYHFTIRFSQSVEKFSGLKLIASLEGALHYFKGAYVPLYVLVFLESEVAVGNFHSYVAMAGFIVTAVLAYQSDRREERLSFAAPALVLMGVLIIALGFVHRFPVWLTLVGIYTFLDNITLPLRFAMPMDLKPTDVGFWCASEFFGNLGRVVCLGVAALFLYFDINWAPFVVFGLIALGYPLAMRRVFRAVS